MIRPPYAVPLRPDHYAVEIEHRRSLLRAITAMAMGNAPDSNAMSVLKAAWPRDASAELVLRAATNPTSTADFPSFNTVAVLPRLAPASAALRLFGFGLDLDMRGVSTVLVPFVAMQPHPVFVGEGQPAPVARLNIGSTSVGPVRKILILSAVSEELQNAVPETATAVVGNALSNAATKSIDAVAFGAAPADDRQPAGLLNNVVPLPASTDTGQTAMAQDVGTLIGAMATAGVDPEGAVIIAAPRQAASLRLLAGPKFDYPILGTTGLVDGSIAAFAPAAIAAAFDGQPTIDASHSVAIHYEDAAPQHISTPPDTVAAPVRSAFQQNVIVIRVRAYATWSSAPGGVQWIGGTNW
jgi:hypothetical protein